MKVCSSTHCCILAIGTVAPGYTCHHGQTRGLGEETGGNVHGVFDHDCFCCHCLIFLIACSVGKGEGIVLLDRIWQEDERMCSSVWRGFVHKLYLVYIQMKSRQ